MLGRIAAEAGTDGGECPHGRVTFSDGDEENLRALLDDDLDGVSEHTCLANKEDTVERR